VHNPMRIASGHSLGRQEWGDPIKVASRDAGSQDGCQRALVGTPRMGGSHKGCQGCWIPSRGDCDVPHRLGTGMRMCLDVYSHSSSHNAF
jgi:hypothetical protein